jgi:hypothetical protein
MSQALGASYVNIPRLSVTAWVGAGNVSPCPDPSFLFCAGF